jgi:hypothetical protein
MYIGARFAWIEGFLVWFLAGYIPVPGELNGTVFYYCRITKPSY